MKADQTSVYKEIANNYYDQVREYDSYGHDVLFGMSFEFVNSGEKLLDIGIGTGLASEKFSQLGLEIYGLDASQEMLNACQAKSFTQELTLFDLVGSPIPYEDDFFNHVICCGVLHFVGDLEALFLEVKRVLIPGGIFAFTIAPLESEMSYLKEDTTWGVPIYKHSMIYIHRILSALGVNVQKEQRLLFKGADKINYNMLFSALVAK